MATSSLPAQTALYRSLLERVGLEEAQDDLFRSGLPFDGQSHLLNHESGEYAYETYGASGLAYCKDYFLGSCYHGAVLDIIAHEGLAGLKDIPACWSAGETRAIQCAHAVGHGLLAWVGYQNLPQALTLCDTLAQSANGFPAFNCDDGAFMENIWAVHDGGVPSPERWVKKADLSYPCDDPRIKPQWQAGCWAEQPSLAYELTGGDISAVSRICNSLSDAALKTQCFEGLARQLHPVAQGDPQKASALCDGVAPEERDFCKTTISFTDYAVGGRSLSFALCPLASAAGENACFSALGQAIHDYSASADEERAQCARLPSSDRAACSD